MGLSMATLASSKVSSRRSPTPRTFRRSTPICRFLGPSVGHSGMWDVLLTGQGFDQLLQSDNWRVAITPSGALSGYLWKFRVPEEVPVLPSLCSLCDFFGVGVGRDIFLFTGGRLGIPSSFDLDPLFALLDSPFSNNSSYSFDKKATTVDKR
jgi:hypothetical protein